MTYFSEATNLKEIKVKPNPCNSVYKTPYAIVGDLIVEFGSPIPIWGGDESEGERIGNGDQDDTLPYGEDDPHTYNNTAPDRDESKQDVFGDVTRDEVEGNFGSQQATYQAGTPDERNVEMDQDGEQVPNGADRNEADHDLAFDDLVRRSLRSIINTNAEIRQFLRGVSDLLEPLRQMMGLPRADDNEV